MQVNRRLYRCRENRVLAGVAGGLAEYFELDPTLVRLLWFVSIFFGGLGLLLYIGMAIIVPIEPITADGTSVVDHAAVAADGTPLPVEGHRHAAHGEGRGTMFVGLVLVLFGGLALLGTLMPSWIDAGRYLVPAFIIGVGALLVANAIRHEPMGS
jgi:phage shock protein C